MIVIFERDYYSWLLRKLDLFVIYRVLVFCRRVRTKDDYKASLPTKELKPVRMAYDCV